MARIRGTIRGMMNSPLPLASKPAPKRKTAEKSVRKRGVSAPLPQEEGNSGRLVVVQNMGPITRAELRLKPLTVFAGPNKTGKTFVSKALYSVFRALNDNHAKVLFELHSENIQDAAMNLRRMMPASIRLHRGRSHSRGEKEDEGHLGDFFPNLSGLLRVAWKKAASMPPDWWLEEHSNEATEIAADLTSKCETLAAFYREKQAALIDAAQKRGQSESTEESGRTGSKERPLARVQEAAKELENALSDLADVPWAMEGRIVSAGLTHALYRRIAANFQTSVEFMPKGMKGLASIEVDGIPEFAMGDMGILHNPGLLPPASAPPLRGRAPVFLEFPGAYWKLRDPLESMRFDLPFRLPRELDGAPRELDGVPQYFYDLAMMLKRKEFPPSVFPNLHERLEGVIGGKIVKSETGELRFQDKEVETPLPMHAAAAGAINLGMLSFLIEKARIDRNSIVFIDEPEINLHPEWQVKMAETLYGLAREGVSIVIATHSIDILKRLEIYAKEDSDAEELIAVNHFRKDGIVRDDDGALDVKLAAVMEELSAPFFNLYMREE